MFSPDLQKCYEYFEKELLQAYDKREAAAITKVVFQHVLKNRLLVGNFHGQTLDLRQLDKIEWIHDGLMEMKPLAYLLGETEFFGLPIKVNKNVLIPRPETEELVVLTKALMEEAALTNGSVLDVGTGSGAIALALKKEMPMADVMGVDVSDEIIATCKLNAKLNNLSVFFKTLNILNEEEASSLAMFDVIVSNPPYVLQTEREVMSQNVLDHEPDVALFVDGDNPFLFYDVILNLAKTKLKKDGFVSFEINEFLKDEFEDHLIEMGIANFEFKKDMSGKWRNLVVWY